MTDDDTVYRCGGDASGPRPIHTDADCPRLDQAIRATEKPRSVLPDDVPVCEWCAGDGAAKAGNTAKDMGPMRALREAAEQS